MEIFLLYSIILGSIMVTFFLCFFSPYIYLKNQEFFFQRRLFFPHFSGKIVLLIAHANSHHIVDVKRALEIHAKFSKVLAFNLQNIQIGISKYHSKISIYLLLSKKGFSRKKISSYLENKLLLVTNLLLTCYDGFADVLSNEQSKILLRFFREKRTRKILDPSLLIFF